ncbi:MAG: DNA replication/repair protein RecF [Oscillospiraceae bacterium]|nr:DNA replication/repair protein RecF [Oscillospiraceae bacterium]
MNLIDIQLTDFRNYRDLTLGFDPGVNLIVGDNAQGKTNLLDAIIYMGAGKSFRTQKSAELVRLGAEFADVSGNVFSQERKQSLRWVLFPAGRPRQLYLNGVKKKTAADIAGVLHTVLFCPEDLMVLKNGASARRRLCDQNLSQLRPNYEAALTEYNRILEQKSHILKDRYENPAVLQILPEYNTRLCQVGALIISYRARYFKALGEKAKIYHELFSGGSEQFHLEYKTVSTVTDPFASTEVLVGQLQEHLCSHERAELESALCLTGPHKDDFDITLSGMSVKSFGSQGQVRTGTISLKLAQRDLMASQTGELPVLLLDDVLSELDPGRQDFVLNQIDQGQVFITCCEPGRFTKLGKTITVRHGEICDGNVCTSL